jgi:branched-chain amino acid transport system permease protein
MAVAYFERARLFGGNGGMSGVPRLDLAWLGIDLGEPGMFALVAMLVAALVLLALDRVVRSPFGQVLTAIHQNEGRARALGCPVGRYKLAAFTLAGLLAGLAGTLMAQLTGFVSPDLMLWTGSGEILIMVIIGGAGSLIGPVAGAAIWILLRNALAGLTQHWMLVMGLCFIAIVLVADEGLLGAFVARRRKA